MKDHRKRREQPTPEWPTPEEWRELGRGAVDRLFCDHITGQYVVRGGDPVVARQVVAFGLRHASEVQVMNSDEHTFAPFPYCPLCGKVNASETGRR